MRKRLRFSRPGSFLMGAGSVFQSLLSRTPRNPALRDAAALREDQLVVAQELWRAVEVFDRSLPPDIATRVKDKRARQER
jgi:hypothetical protein